MAMKEPVPNVPTNQWYEKQNHVEIPQVAESKALLDAFYTGEGGGAVEGAPENSSLPVIAGTPTVGQLLTCSTGTWTNSPTSYSYRWQAAGVFIAGATASTYTVTANEVGKYMSCSVVASNAFGNSARTWSVGVGPIAGIPVNTALPVVSGTPLVGNVLACSAGQWSAYPAPTYSYRWVRNGVSNISGATAATYLLVAADAGQLVTCRVTATNSGGPTNAMSNNLGAINMPPNNLTLPVASGDATVGGTLTTTDGTWEGYPAPVFAYQWRANGVDILGATSKTFVCTRDQLGFTPRCGVTASNAYGDQYQPSNNVSFVTGIPVVVSAPEIEGEPLVGSTLTSTTGDWTGYPAPTYTFAWFSDGVPSTGQIISDFLGATYVVQDADAGKHIYSTVTANNTVGETASNSNTIGPIVDASWQSPTNTVAPVVSGSPIVGSVLACSTGTWTGNPAPTFAYLWRRGGATINGATASTYTLVEADLGLMLDCLVAATNSAGTGTPASATAVGPISPANSAVSDTIITGGVTIVLSEPCAYGHTLDGMAWIVIPVGGVTVLSRSPAQTTDGGLMVNGTMKNPQKQQFANQGYDARVTVSYSVTNLATFPLAVSRNDIVVCAIGQPGVTSAQARHGVVASYAGFHFVATPWPANVIAPAVNGWSGRGTPTYYSIDLDAIVADFPAYDTTAMSRPDLADMMQRVTRFEPAWGFTANDGDGGYEYLTTYMVGLGSSNWGGYIGPVVGACLLYMLSSDVSVADKKAIALALISNGVQDYDPAQGAGIAIGTSGGGHRQFDFPYIIMALKYTGREALLSTMKTVAGTNQLLQTFLYDQALIDEVSTPHTNMLKSQFSRQRQIVGVNGLEIRIQTERGNAAVDGGDGARMGLTQMLMTRVSDGAQARITSPLEGTTIPGGSSSFPYNIDAHPTPSFTIGDMVYMVDPDTIRVDDADWLHSNLINNTSQVNPCYTQQYRDANFWSEHIIGARALGIWAPDFNVPEAYVARANRANDPGPSRDYPHHNYVLAGTTFAGDFWAAYAEGLIGDKPVYLSTLEIRGINSIDETLTLTGGTVSGVQPITKAYQWYKNDVAILNATAQTYTLLAGDLGAMISAREVSTNAIGSTTLYATPVGPVDSGYQVNAVAFSGTNWLLSTTGITIPAQTSKFMLSFSLYMPTLVAGAIFYAASASGTQVLFVSVNVNGGLSITLRDGAGASIYSGSTANGTIQAGVWQTIVIGTDISSGMLTKMVGYRRPDGGSFAVVSWSNNPAMTPDRTWGTVGRVGIANSGGSQVLTGYLADVWADLTSYIDLSVPENVEKFLPTKSKGVTGAEVTGTTPGLFLSGETAGWPTNKAPYGGIAVVGGAPTTAPSVPT